MRRCHVILFVLALPVLFAQDLPPRAKEHTVATPEPKLIRVQTEWIEVPRDVLAKLLLQRSATSADATSLRKQIQGMVGAGTAKVLELQVLTSRSGESATLESCREVIYPTDPEPPSNPGPGPLPTPPPRKPDNFQAVVGLIVPPVPATFATRNVGSTLEVRATASDSSQFIDLSFSPSLTWHPGRTVWHERKNLAGHLIKIERPGFYRLQPQTALTLKSGTYTLAAIVTPHGQNGRADFDRKVMLFVKATILAVK